MSCTAPCLSPHSGKPDSYLAAVCCTHLAEVTRVVLVEHDAVVVLATGISATSWVLPVLANTAMTGADVPALLAVLAQACTEDNEKDW